MDEFRRWHRLFGLSWVDFFTGQPVTVEIEKDLSLKQQLLDVVLIRTDPTVPMARPLPDGFDDLAAHNLISFKSFQETLDGWTLTELLGHYVNYRKQLSNRGQPLLPEDQFRLLAVCVRYPQQLATQIPLEQVQAGVYQARHFSGMVRLVVVHQLPQTEHNALLHLFSARQEAIDYGRRHYRPQSPMTSQFLGQLWGQYRQEGLVMPYTVEDFRREVIEDLLKDPEVMRLMLQKVPSEEKLKGLTAEERLKGLTREELAALQRKLERENPASG